MDGFINVLKPPGMTSSDAVLFVRRLLPRKTAVGHGGTLDPDAAGVLPVCVGRATRLFDYIIDKTKVYIGELCLGVTTDTADASGKVLETRPVRASADDVKRVLPEFTGHIWQVPPMYSALKRDGRPLYELARRGETLDIPAREVVVHGVEYLCETAPGRHLLAIECGKGVYIRSLMRDIGERLGDGGHMSFLLRARAGAFTVNDAYTLDELKAMGDLTPALRPMDALLGGYIRVDVRGQYEAKVRAGVPLRPEWTENCPDADGFFRVYVNGVFAGMGEKTETGEIRFRAMLLPPINETLPK